MSRDTNHSRESENVRNFLSKHIDSVEQLSVLLLLHADPAKLWSVHQITQALQSSFSSVEKRLSALYERKVLRKEESLKGLHRFSPYSEDIEMVVKELAEFNRIRHYRVIEMIYSQPDLALKAFADAFRWKKE